MKDKTDLIIGEKMLRDLQPGMTIEQVKEREGEPLRVKKTYTSYLEYQLDPELGEELIIYYFYDEETEKVKTIEVFFYFFPYDHDNSNEIFLEIKDQILERYNKAYGKAKRKIKGSGSKKETYFQWKIESKKVKQKLTLMQYKDEDSSNPDDSKEILKIVFNESK